MDCQLQITTALDSQKLVADLKQRLGWLQQRGYSLEVMVLPDELSYTLVLELGLKGICKDLVFREEDIECIFKHQIAELVAEHIIRDWETKLVSKEILRRRRCILTADQESVLKKACTMLTHCNASDSLNLLMNYGRKNKIAHRIMDHLNTHDVLVVEGFINFCMQDFLREVRFAVDLACEELRNEKEYNEFVKLLRYFVDSQPPRVFEVNLFMDQKGFFFLWDGDGAKIEEDYINYYLEEIFLNEISLDDVLVSILITIAPRRIILHNLSEFHNNESVQTIKEVFAERISECSGCERCKIYKKGDLKV